MKINVYVDNDFGWTEVDGVDAYEFLSYTFPIIIELILDVCKATIKLFIILTCIRTACINLFIQILVASIMYVIQFSIGVLQMLVQESQNLFTLAKGNFDYGVTNDFRSILTQRLHQSVQAFSTLVILFSY